MGTVLPISLKQNFSPNTLGCHGLRRRFKTGQKRANETYGQVAAARIWRAKATGLRGPAPKGRSLFGSRRARGGSQLLPLAKKQHSHAMHSHATCLIHSAIFVGAQDLSISRWKRGHFIRLRNQVHCNRPFVRNTASWRRAVFFQDGIVNFHVWIFYLLRYSPSIDKSSRASHKEFT